jgi:DNA-binding beta-propeller fold protein YncE
MDLTPDGLYAFVANFNLHGEMVHSTVSVVYTPDMVEVDQIETCIMPHGARMEPSGIFLYTNCMMDDIMVEIDTRSFEVSRRFSLATGQEAPIASGAMSHAMGDEMEAHHPGGVEHDPSCSPTWVQPSADGSRLYVACNKGDYILELDRLSLDVQRRFETGRGPYNLSVTPDGRLLVATLKQGAAVEFIDLRSGESLGRIPSSTTVTHGVAVSPDSRYAFVSVEGVGAEPGKVDIYDLRERIRLADVSVGQQAGGIVFWKMETP